MMQMTLQINSISEAVRRITKTMPPDVLLLAAAKTRSLEEVEEVIRQHPKVYDVAVKEILS